MVNAGKSILKRFKRDEDGSATVEAVLWIPFFLIFFLLVTDAAFIYFGQNKALRVVQDVNRQWSVGRHNTDAEVETAALAAVSGFAPNAKVDAKTNSSGVITTTIVIPASDLDAVGIVTSLANANVYATSSHLREY